MKKNRRKKPEKKKPFMVLTPGKIGGWLVLIFFLCVWMFVLGILVGRGTAPVKFDIPKLQDKLKSSAKELRKQKGSQAQEDSIALEDKTKLDFYEALKEKREDTTIPALQKPKIIRQKVAKTPEKTISQTPKETAPKEATSKVSPSEKTVPKKETAKDKVTTAKKSPLSGGIYTLQAASVRDPNDANRLVQKLKKRGYPAYRVLAKIPGKGIWFRVRIGEFKTKTEARPILNKLKKEGYKPILVRK
jgi:DedD protein